MDPNDRNFTGIIKFYNSKKGYGFIVPDHGGEDVLIEAPSLQGGTPTDGDKVSFQLLAGEGGPRAQQVQVL